MSRVLIAGFVAILSMTTAEAQTGATSTDSCADHLNTSTSVTPGAVLSCLADMQRHIDRLETQLANASQRQPDTPPSIPANAVVAFALPDPGNPDINPCPKGWERYVRANGRFIVGVGTHRANLSALSAFETDGERTHTLKVEEMPTHSHLMSHLYHREAQGSSTNRINYDADEVGRWRTSEEGGGLPHNNMPPYISLYFCKKEAG